MVEFRDQALRGTVPELEDRRDQSDAGHVVGQSGGAEHLQRDPVAHARWGQWASHQRPAIP